MFNNQENLSSLSDRQLTEKMCRLLETLVDGGAISSMGVPNPYKQFSFTIADGDMLPIYYAFDYARFLQLSTATGVTMRFGANGTFSDIIDAGVGQKLKHPTDRMEIRNNSGGILTGKVALCLGGYIDDNRFVLVNNTAINVKDVATGFASGTDVALNNATATQIAASNTARAFITISNLDTAIDVYLGDSGVNNTTERGILLPPRASISIPSTGAIYGIAASGTPSVSFVNSDY